MALDLAELIDKLPPLKIPGLRSTETIGIDIGSYAIKIVQIKKVKDKQELVRWSVIPLISGGEADRPELTPEEKKAQAISLLNAYRGSGKNIPKNAVFSVSGNAVIVRYVKFQKLTYKELSKAIKAEAEPYIPFNVEEVYIGFHLLGDVQEDGKQKMETVLVAAKKDYVTWRIEILEEAGFNSAIVDVDAFALETAYEATIPPPIEGTPPIEETVLIANIGYTKTNFTVIENGISTVVKDTPIAGQSMTKQIVKTLGVDSKTAEKLKLAHGIFLTQAEYDAALLAEQKEALAISEAASAMVKDLAQEVKKIVQYFITQGKDKRIHRILISGGSANIKNIIPFLSEELNLPVARLNPFSQISGAEGIPEEYYATLGIATGLAQRKIGDIKES